MTYALLIYGDDSAWVDLPDEEKAALHKSAGAVKELVDVIGM